MSGTTPNPTTWGWQNAGFQVPTISDVRTFAVARFDQQTGVTTPLNETSPVFMLYSAIAELVAENMQAVAESVNALDPANASGEALDAVARRLFVYREPASASTALLRLTGTVGVVVPAGWLFADPSGTWVFATDSEATIAASGHVDVGSTCTENGPFDPATITQIVNPLSGLASVAITPGESVSPGEYIETDASLRLRLPAAAWSIGAGTRDAIRNDLLQVAGVTKAQVWLALTDGGTQPKGTFEPVIYPDVSGDLLMQPIYQNLVGGCDTYGAESQVYTTPTDSRVIRWSVATEVVIDVDVTDVVIDGSAPSNWSELMVAAITDLIDGYNVGDLVRFRQIQAKALGMTGIVDGVVVIRADAGSWVTTNIAIGHREVAIVGTVTASE